MFNANDVASLKVESGDFHMLASDMPLTTVAYLLANGFSQSLTDARTSAQAKVLEAAMKAAGAGADKAQVRESCKAEMETAGLEAMSKRYQALAAGTMVYGARGPNGPRKSPEEAYLWSRAEADGKATLTRKGIAHPKGKEELDAMVQKVLSVKGESYRKDWAKQQAMSGGLDDLF